MIRLLNRWVLTTGSFPQRMAMGQQTFYPIMFTKITLIFISMIRHVACIAPMVKGTVIAVFGTCMNSVVVYIDMIVCNQNGLGNFSATNCDKFG
jgi:hypothetical protein